MPSKQAKPSVPTPTEKKPGKDLVRLGLFRPEMTDEEIQATLDKMYEGLG